MLSANYHTHTKRCGHATGDDEDYVLEAIGSGYRHLGFSDHAMLPGYSEPYKRGDYSMFDDYTTSIRSLRKKYEDRIKIYLGFEAEAYPCYFPFYRELLSDGILDYLILGNHSAMSDSHEVYAHFSHINNASELYLYRDLAIQAISSGMFSIFAHPDYFMAGIPEFDSDCKKISRDIIEACIAYDVPLEVNVAGIRNGEKQIGDKRRYLYPTDEFFSLVSRYHARCIIGMDAHAPEQLMDEGAVYQAVEFCHRHDLEVIDVLDNIKEH